jgi:tRNA synthetases class I (I, L, M and V)
MASGYNPIAVESAWYDWWDAQGMFAPRMGPDGKPKPEGLFVIPAPPPNVTGSLHIGHGLTVAIQDTLVRWYDRYEALLHLLCHYQESNARKDGPLCARIRSRWNLDSVCRRKAIIQVLWPDPSRPGPRKIPGYCMGLEERVRRLTYPDICC